MVASVYTASSHCSVIFVSIPFIAGQWSLLNSAQTPSSWAEMFQSPSLRGSGRFNGRWFNLERRGKVSIPFIAGQWSLRPVRRRRLPAAPEFQSPSLRGSGRFFRYPAVRLETVVFQSPSLRGSGRFPQPPRSPYGGRGASFNPLHCGAVVASC